ncbi:MAG: signal peptidase I [Candidatus Actinomarina sp.]
MTIKKIIKTLLTILVAILAATFVRTFIIQIYFIPSSSMEPTLEINDRVLVLKDAFANIDIESGDIVIFYNPETPYTEDFLKEYYQALQIWNLTTSDSILNSAIIKRVVGVGGDTVNIMQDGKVFVNGEQFVVLNIDETSFFREETYIVPENEIFVLGDNRINSQDSRYIGTVPINNIVGKASYVIYPFDNYQNLND